MDFSVEIKQITVINDYLRIFRVERPLNFNHKPGQYVWMKNEVDKAPMAIASGTSESELIFAIRKWGKLTEFLFTKKVGEFITLEGPYGTYLEILDDQKLLLIAAGSGITPIRSVIFDTHNNQTSLIYGCRIEGDILFHEELKQVLNHYTPILSQPSKHWNGKTGYVTDFIKEINLKSDQVIVFICGPNDMMIETYQLLLDKGFSKNQIYLSLEKFDSAGNVIGPVVNLDHPEVNF